MLESSLGSQVIGNAPSVHDNDCNKSFLVLTFLKETENSQNIKCMGELKMSQKSRLQAICFGGILRISLLLTI